MPTCLTKIIAALGPATASRKTIKELVDAGVNVFRLNLSHGDHNALRRRIRWIRMAEKESKTFLAILLDLQGPKIRVGKFEKGAITLQRGKCIWFTTESGMGNDSLVPVQYRQFHKEVEVGMQVHLDNGNLRVRVLKISVRRVEMEVEMGGRL